MTILFSVLCFSFIVFSVAEAVHGEEAPVWKAFSRMAAGTALLYVLHVVSPYTGIEAPISLASLGVSAVLGVPGVALLLFMDTFFI